MAKEKKEQINILELQLSQLKKDGDPEERWEFSKEAPSTNDIEKMLEGNVKNLLGKSIKKTSPNSKIKDMMNAALQQERKIIARLKANGFKDDKGALERLNVSSNSDMKEYAKSFSNFFTENIKSNFSNENLYDDLVNFLTVKLKQEDSLERQLLSAMNSSYMEYKTYNFREKARKKMSEIDITSAKTLEDKINAYQKALQTIANREFGSLQRRKEITLDEEQVKGVKETIAKIISGEKIKIDEKTRSQRKGSITSTAYSKYFQESVEKTAQEFEKIIQNANNTNNGSQNKSSVSPEDFIKYFEKEFVKRLAKFFVDKYKEKGYNISEVEELIKQACDYDNTLQKSENMKKIVKQIVNQIAPTKYDPEKDKDKIEKILFPKDKNGDDKEFKLEGKITMLVFPNAQGTKAEDGKNYVVLKDKTSNMAGVLGEIGTVLQVRKGMGKFGTVTRTGQITNKDTGSEINFDVQFNFNERAKEAERVDEQIQAIGFQVKKYSTNIIPLYEENSVGLNTNTLQNQIPQKDILSYKWIIANHVALNAIYGEERVTPESLNNSLYSYLGQFLRYSMYKDSNDLFETKSDVFIMNGKYIPASYIFYIALTAPEERKFSLSFIPPNGDFLKPFTNPPKWSGEPKEIEKQAFNLVRIKSSGVTVNINEIFK